MATLIGSETATTVRRSQVYQATHEGEKILPFMNRSFISFTFGGKRIEEFDLIATISGDRLNRPGYASFKDTISTYDNLDGQYYWGTHYEGNQMEFVLATDGIDQKKLDDFLHWFRAGATRELILSEHPNRAILARVANPPQLDLLPFEQPITLTISSNEYKTSTTLYKGEINLTLTMDEPHWYSVKNILGEEVTRDGKKYYEDVWRDLNTNNPVSIFASKDALKILYEDGIPLGSMIEDNMLLGNGAYAKVKNEDKACIWSISEEDDSFIPYGESGFPGSGYGARIVANNATSNYTAIIAGAMVDISGNGIESLTSSQQAYFYYAGTAPSPTIISFTLKPEFNNSSKYIVTPKNGVSGGTAYNTLTITSTNTQELRFTAPNIFTSYNKVIKIFTDMVGKTWEDIRKKIRDNVRHPVVRAWANKVIDSAQTSSQSTTESSSNATTMKTRMRQLFTDSSGVVQDATFVFNSQTGEAKGTFTHRAIVDDTPPALSNSNWANYGAAELVTETEDVGDMLKSNYIIIQDRNYPTDKGKVKKWQDIDGERQYSHMIKHNCYSTLTNISILYKNMYL